MRAILDECVKFAARDSRDERTTRRWLVLKTSRESEAASHMCCTRYFSWLCTECTNWDHWSLETATKVSFSFPFQVRMRNRTLYFPVGCTHAQQYFPYPVLDFATLRPLNMHGKKFRSAAAFLIVTWRTMVLTRQQRHFCGSSGPKAYVQCYSHVRGCCCPEHLVRSPFGAFAP